MPKLTAVGIKGLRETGRYGDGGGLYLQVARGGSRSWLFRYKLRGRPRQMGLGTVGDTPAGVPLAEARRLAAEARGLVRRGVDPIEARREAERTAEAERQRAAPHTFRAVADALVASPEAEWRNVKHRAQWRSTLDTYAHSVIGDLPVAAVDTDAVLRVLLPLWTAKPETASRLRGRMEAVLDYAKTRGLRIGENPARWRGHLSVSLAKPSKVRRVRRHPALAWERTAAFVAELRARDDVSARALEFLVLTATRTGEVLGATWQEVDFEGATWTVPADRMKAGREHRVPLSAPALAVLRALLPFKRAEDSPVFPGQRPGKPLSNMALEMLLRRMNGTAKGDKADGKAPAPLRWADRHGEAITAHGFRSTFRDWAGEASAHPADLAEAALAHATKDKTVAAYARGDLFAKRAKMMADWAEWCGKAPAAVIALPARDEVAA